MLDLNTLQLPSTANLFASVMFGIVGYAAYRYGRKTELRNPVIIGIALMIYPFFVTQTWAIYAVGLALCAALYLFRQPS